MKNFNFGCLVKILALIAMVFLIAVLIMTCSGQGFICRPIDKTLPDVTKAPFSIATETYLYYAHYAVENTDGSATMTNWYERVNNQWVYHEETIVLPPVLHPKVKRR